MQYPTLEEADKATRREVCRWGRFLPSPDGDAQVKVMNRIAARFKAFGGFTPRLSKCIGWDPPS